MDIIRDTKPQKKKKRVYWTASIVIAVVLITVVIRQLPSAAPSVEAATVWRDTVEQGTMVRQVRGPGTLVPEQMRWMEAFAMGLMLGASLGLAGAPSVDSVCADWPLS